jgi:glycosyltransferase domain-containing protein
VKQHTLVIPTYNRPALVRRLAGYYVGRVPELSILVLDSSRPEVAAENASALAALGGPVRHVAYPDTMPPGAKIAAGLALVQTPYVSLCADDDLVFPGGLREAIAFLEGHSDYVCAHGLCLNFRQDGTDVHIAREYAGPDNDAKHPGARIFRLLQKYESLYYAVFRTADMRDVFSALATLPELAFQELLQSVAALIKGKVRRFSEFHAVRQSGPAAQSDRDKWQTYYWFANDPGEVMEHYRAYRDAVWRFYEAHGAIPRMAQADFCRALDLAHAVYLASGCPPEYFYSVLQPHWPEDPYRPIGWLAGARQARYGRLLNWTGFGGSRADADMLDSLRRPAGLPPALGALAELWRFACSVPGNVLLASKVHAACRTSWKCRLSPGIFWLSALPKFRDSYVELCRYLDRR